MGIFDKLFKKNASAAPVQSNETFVCPACGAKTQDSQRRCANCGWDDFTCPYITGFSAREQLLTKCRLKTGNNDCMESPYGLLFEDCPIYRDHQDSERRKAAGGASKKATSILDKYRAGLLYLDGCARFDEAEFRELNRILGNRFSEDDIRTQLVNAKSMMRGMDDLKKVLRSNIVEAIGTFEQLEQSGIDLSKYNI